MAQFYSPSSLESFGEDWFPLSEVSHKRDQLAGLVRTLAEKQHGQELMWPEINFLGPAAAPRARRMKVEEEYDVEEKFLEGHFLEAEPGPSFK